MKSNPRGETPRNGLVERWLAFEPTIAPACAGDAVAIHDARVASRRLREALAVYATHQHEPRRLVRRLSRALGRLRELDVTLERLDESLRRLDSTVDVALAARLVRREVQKRRGRERAATKKALSASSQVAIRASMGALVERLGASFARSEEPRERLAARLLARTKTLESKVRRIGDRYDPPKLHRVRLAVKKLRYTLELRGESALLGTLKRAQDDLGRLHDLEVLLELVARTARATRSGSRPRSREALAVLRRHLEAECARQHARYLRRRSELMTACTSVRDLIGDARPRRPRASAVPPSRERASLPSCS